MFRPLAHSLPNWRRAPRRGGAVLLTCFSLITILMVLGLAFMMYAAKEKAVAQAYQEAAAAPSRIAPDPTNTINRFFGTLIYDERDDHNATDGGSALLNAMRGHSIARSMYGSRHTFDPLNPNAPWIGSTVPWAGVGTFHETNAYGDRALQVNHQLVIMGATPYMNDPEWTGHRGVTTAGVPAFAGSTSTPVARNYVGKHAGYTYPDLKSFFLGARDPATGEVLMQSFHRPWLFGSLDPTNGGVAAANNNWTNTNGKLLILRPRPAEHPRFPRVPPNADGTYTGDVQNLPGAVGVQRNDSLWMHIGLAPITLEDGRIVQPMIAALILALDGKFDLSVHGNRLGAGSAHAGHGGYGPWEINPNPGIANDAERQALIVNRTPSRGASFDPFTSGTALSNSAGVAWTGTAVNFQLPSGGSLRGVPSSGDPTFAPANGGFQNDNAAANPHPAGYNTNEWLDRGKPAGVANSPIYPYSDLKRLSLRYAFTPDWFDQAFVAKTDTGTVLKTFAHDRATTTFAYQSSPGATGTPANTPHAYRLDPAHTRRLLFSPKNNGLDRPAITPTFSYNVAQALQLTATGKPGALPTTPGGYPTAGTGLNPITDFVASDRWVNAKAALGSVNLNRPLADYRVRPAQALFPNPALPLTDPANSNVTVASAALADADRTQFAKDIFARLVVALGAAATVDASGNVAIDPTAPPAQFNALRYLAQVAVNLVDYIDSDDVITVFRWNPAAPGEVVYGVEKPRLVINEAYSEIVNAPNDVPPAKIGDANVRFWLELLNPGTTPTAGTLMGDGSVPLSAYRIEIRRTFRQTGGAADAVATNQTDYLFNDPTNTAGAFKLTGPGAYDADAVYEFSAGAVGPNHNPTTTAGNNAYAPPAASLPPNGFLLVGPKADVRGDEFAPPPAGVWANKVESGAPAAAPNSPAMGYTIPIQPMPATYSNAEFKRHVVLLRRAANPYLQPDATTNPYVTVDMMDYVPSFDAVGLTSAGMARPAPPAAGGYDPVAQRFAVGKVQPYAGRAVGTAAGGAGAYNVYNGNATWAVASSLADSMVRDQTTANGANQPKHTFGRHNGNVGHPAGTTFTAGGPAALSDTLMTPFDWLPHMDRPLETLGDVFLVRDCKPHLLTHEFAVPVAAAPGVNYETSYAKWTAHNDGLARALEYLTVKSPEYRVGHGGRVGGKVNVNVMQDRRVAQGVWDPQASNRFNAAFVSDTVWGDAATAPAAWMKSRTPLAVRLGADGTTRFQVPVPTSSVADRDTGTDRPFLPFGAPVSLAGTFAYTNPLVGGEGDTIWRRDTSTSNLPYLQLATAGQVALTPAEAADATLSVTIPQRTISHPYTRTEPMRKVIGNVTTVSHMFVAYVTIGYFEVTNPFVANWPTGIPLPPQFGPEVYDKIPGDMRQKYMGVIDMSNMALKGQAVANDPDPHAPGQPFFTALDKTTYYPPTAPATLPVLSIAHTSYDPAGNGTVYVAADGVQQPITVGTQLVIGYGADQQPPNPTTAQPSPTPVVVTRVLGAGQLEVSGMTRTAWGGSVVSNVRPGYAGPQYVNNQFVFDYTAAKYKPVIPYVERLR